MNSPISKQMGIEMGDNPHQQNEGQEDNYFHASRRLPRFQLVEHSAHLLLRHPVQSPPQGFGNALSSVPLHFASVQKSC
jgi:hypothetical protein